MLSGWDVNNSEERPVSCHHPGFMGTARAPRFVREPDGALW